MDTAGERPQLGLAARHGISETLWPDGNTRSGESPDRGCGCRTGQRADAFPGDAAERRYGYARPAGKQVPADRPERALTGMARRREGRPEKDDIRAGAGGAGELGPIMRRGRQDAAPWPRHCPPAATMMQPGVQVGGEAHVAGNDQDEPPGAAEPGQGPAERGAARRFVMAEDNPGKTRGKPGHGRKRVGQAAFVGEEPKGRQRKAAPCLDRTRPGDEPRVHE